jgi:hypothetical protein
MLPTKKHNLHLAAIVLLGFAILPGLWRPLAAQSLPHMMSAK